MTSDQDTLVSDKALLYRKWVLAVLFISLVLIDQISKLQIVAKLNPGERIAVIPGLFDLTLTYNPGAAFGILAGLPATTRHIVLGVTTVLALALVFYFMLRDYRNDSVAKFALVMILAGAAGNIIDRVRLGVVIDFLDFYVGSWHWPAFNVADSAICVGVAILLLRTPLRVKSATE